MDGQTSQAADSAPWTGQQVSGWTVAVFYLLAVALAWVVDAPLWLSGRGLDWPAAAAVIAMSAYSPLVAAVAVVRLIEHVPLRQLPQRLGWVPVRPIRRTLLLTAVGVAGSALLPVLAVLLAVALGWMQLDLTHFSSFAAALHASGQDGLTSVLPVQLLAVLQLVAIPAAAIPNSAFTLGEETGWRGFLLPALRPLGTWPALLFSGALWGLWHAPVILLGYNFDEPNGYGLTLMVIGCAIYGVLIGWLRVRSGTIWPSVLAHGAFNAAAGVSLLVARVHHLGAPAAVGPLGFTAWMVMGLLGLLLLLTRQVPDKRHWASTHTLGATGD